MASRGFVKPLDHLGSRPGDYNGLRDIRTAQQSKSGIEGRPTGVESFQTETS